MRIRQVKARAFGPYADRTLELAEGMTVIAGLNEAGKSSWHAAIYAALCGMRRGRGRRTKDDDLFAQRHEPWDGAEWEVSCVLELPDGRRVELHHDLSGRVDCSARDLDLGTDITHEIIHDGSPDGSRWLGLERRAFLAVASIRQGQILSITEHAGGLQEYLQRAAATVGTDETATAALSSIDAYSREHVGIERVNAQKPLMKAIRRHEQAKMAHESAVSQHHDWLQRQEQVGQLAARAAEARDHARAVEARYAQQAAAQINDRLLEARELAERHPTPPANLREEAKLEQTVIAGLYDWTHRPDPMPLKGPTARDLEERLKSLPSQPIGDLEVAPSVQSAYRTLLSAQARCDAHLEKRPPEESTIVVETNVTESELIDLARELEVSVPQVDHDLEDAERLRAAAVRSQSRGRRKTGIGFGIGALAAGLVGVGLLGTGATLAGFVGVGIGVLLGIGSAWLMRNRVGDDDAELRAVEARLLIAEQFATTAREHQQNAATRAVVLGLDPDPAHLRRMADDLRRAELARGDRGSWEAEQRLLSGAVTQATQALAQELSERGVAVESSATVEELEASLARYDEDCRQRREMAAAAKERASLEQILDARRRAESQLAEDQRRLERARQALQDAAMAAGIVDEETPESVSEDELASRLQAWHEHRQQLRDKIERARNEWSRLQALLDGGTLEDLETRARAARVRADDVGREVDADLVRDTSLGGDPELTVREARERAESLEREVAAAVRELEVRAEQAVSVAEAEEQLAIAEDELKRVRSLAEVLEITRRFLIDAQERVHHDIAPVLASKVRDRLARVTGGRYEAVSVDPQTLNVQVRDADGRWRHAEYLSHGTAEQVYLLLRVAMAEILTPEGVSCPLLFDDSTVQSDPQRTHAILDVLHEVSGEHQVIVFSQEDTVTAWAQDHLGSRDRFQYLDVEPIEQH